jgi:hypothetical protein
MLNPKFMTENFLVYIEHLGLMTFFSGYPLVYALVHFITGNNPGVRNPFLSRLRRNLPIAYALTGTFFFLFWIREIIIRSGIKNISPVFDLTLLKAWALLSVFFWIPGPAKKPVYSLMHSLVFFFLLFKDIITGFGSETGMNIISNDMKVYTVSLALNLLSLIFIMMSNRIFVKWFPPR